MAQYEHLPIYKAAFDLVVYFEEIVRHFSRYNKYTHGTALRESAHDILLLIVRANSSAEKRPLLAELRLKIEELKVELRVCKEVKAFHNFNSFETSINHVIRIAKQNEGWIRSLSVGSKRPESRPDAIGS